MGADPRREGGRVSREREPGVESIPTWNPEPSEEVLARLKPFQRAAVEHAFHRLFEAEDGTRRFLVADEVGLGKTHIAKGLISRTIEHLQRIGRERIDVIYICSNRQIARQNVRKLGGDSVNESAERLTLLPLTVHELQAQKVNFVAFTPGTSFDLNSRLGTRRERLLLLNLFEAKWRAGGTGPMNLFQGTVKDVERFREAARFFREDHEIDPGLEGAFHEALEQRALESRSLGGEDLEQRYRRLCEQFRHLRERWPDELRGDRNHFIRESRELLARVCIHALEPDLVILDEFQRFKHLLGEEGEAAMLAQQLFRYAEGKDSAVRVVLLSATPYKMYTLSHEREEDDHYADFLGTVRFLDPDPERCAAFERGLREWRRAFFQLQGSGVARLRELRREMETHLRRLLSRTERVGVAGDRDAMLMEVSDNAPSLTARDVAAFVPLQRVASLLERPRVVEYWKAAPCPLNFMEEYLLKHDLEQRLDRSDQGLFPTVLLEAGTTGALLDANAVDRYEPLDVPHPAFRALTNDLVRKNAFRCLWIPPSLPYWRLGEPFATAQAGGMTKRLMFSAWAVAPRAIASLLSYEAERCLVTALEGEGAANTKEARKTRQSFLSLGLKDGQPGEMSVFTLLYPSSTLAELGDPLLLGGDPGNVEEPRWLEVRSLVARGLEPHLARLAARYATTSGTRDPAWYWAGPMLLDLARHQVGAREFWSHGRPVGWTERVAVDEEDPESAWGRHVEHAWEVLHGVLRGQRQLGPMPEDLPDVLASIALAGPGTATLRALLRAAPARQAGPSCGLRNAAARIGWAFRTLLRRPESTATIRHACPRPAYWQSVLEYAGQGCLTAVLDEWFHLLIEQQGGARRIEDQADDLVEEVAAALSVRATTHEYDDFEFTDGRVEIHRRSLRAHFALRFGSEKSEDETQLQREAQVRQAFNSPFWPFVLCSTSVGQEGLDFHPYCHAIVHWNLPSNPVDMEQREGRVHRYKNHAVRKNVAAVHGSAALDRVRSGAARDPWFAMFELAEREASPSDRGLAPYWMFPGSPDGARVERHVPHLPVSREAQRSRDLRSALTTYRLVFGQPRQDDLMAWLREHQDEMLADLAEELRINLAPPLGD